MDEILLTECTVGKLKKALGNFPDDLAVIVYDDRIYNRLYSIRFEKGAEVAEGNHLVERDVLVLE